MALVIGKRFRFDAAHRLPLHEGKCSRPHGHSYILEVEIEGPVKQEKCSSQGMIIDYAVLKAIVERQIMSVFDHQDLNQAVKALGTFKADPEEENVTTAERLVLLCVAALTEELEKCGAGLTRVCLQETQDTWAEWTPSKGMLGLL